MSEKRAFKKLKAELVKDRNRRLDRVENILAAGVPDCNGCFDGVEFWIEVKEPTEPKRASTKLFGSNHKLSQDQMNWIKRQHQTGGRAYVYIDTGRNRMLIGGSLADEINDMTLQQLANAALWHSRLPTPASHWEGIADVILQRRD